MRSVAEKSMQIINSTTLSLHLQHLEVSNKLALTFPTAQRNENGFILSVSCKNGCFFLLGDHKKRVILQGVIERNSVKVQCVTVMDNRRTNKSYLSIGHVADQLFDPQQSQRVLVSHCNITKQTAGCVSAGVYVCDYLLCKCRFTDTHTHTHTTRSQFNSGRICACKCQVWKTQPWLKMLYLPLRLRLVSHRSSVVLEGLNGLWLMTSQHSWEGSKKKKTILRKELCHS